MTPLDFQSKLKKRVEEVVRGWKLKGSNGQERHIQVFEQHLPNKEKSQSRNSQSDFYPCVLVYLDEGSSNAETVNEIKVYIVAGVYDDNSDNQGYRDAMNIIQKLKEDLIRKPMIDGKFELKLPVKWKYDGEDNGAFHYALIEAEFIAPDSMREDVEAMI